MVSSSSSVKGSSRHRFVAVAAAGLALLILGVIVAVVYWLIPFQSPPTNDGPDVSGVTLAQVIDRPERFVTERVTLVGRVDERISSVALTIESPETGDDELLVVVDQDSSSTESGSIAWSPGQAVEVSGTIRRFQLPFIAEVTGVDLNASTLDDYFGEPVVVADRIVETTMEDVVAEGGVLSPEALASRFDDLRGSSQGVRGEVERAIAPEIFAFDDGAVIVVLQQPVDGLAGDVIALVEGEVDRFALERVAEHTGISVDPADFSDLSDRPTVYATSVEVLDSLEAISEQPRRFLGQQVTVLGTVGEELGPNGFTYTESGVLVITTDVAIDLVPNASVRTVGEVRIFDLQEIGAITGEDLDAEVFREYLGEPAIVAETVEVYQ